jgi:hypothetical protein
MSRKKPKCLSYIDEIAILNHHQQGLYHCKGVLKKMLWYNTIRYFIRGNKKMYKS